MPRIRTHAFLLASILASTMTLVGQESSADPRDQLRHHGATDEQIAKLTELHFHLSLRAIDLDAAVRKAELTAHHLFSQPDTAEETLLAAIDELFAARGVVLRHKAQGLLHARTILGDAIWKKVHLPMTHHVLSMDLAHATPHEMAHGGKRPSDGTSSTQQPAPTASESLHEHLKQLLHGKEAAAGTAGAK
ncbi:MAG: hypothetical protein H6834_15575 [Planctomycetes bacterium]|nr:hypothetical protein [Planctomycetota bacterium]